MKVLLDENLPHKLRGLLPGHEVMTVAFMGWGGLKNGELLKAAEDAGFDVFLTGDQILHYEQNVLERRLALLILSAQDWPIIKQNVAQIAAAIKDAKPGMVVVVDCGVFVRRRRAKVPE